MVASYNSKNEKKCQLHRTLRSLLVEWATLGSRTLLIIAKKGHPAKQLLAFASRGYKTTRKRWNDLKKGVLNNDWWSQWPLYTPEFLAYELSFYELHNTTKTRVFLVRWKKRGGRNIMSFYHFLLLRYRASFVCVLTGIKWTVLLVCAIVTITEAVAQRT